MTGAGPSSLVNDTVKSTAVPAGPIAVGDAVTVGLGALGGVPASGVAHIWLTCTPRVPPPVFVVGYWKVTSIFVIFVQSIVPSKPENGNAALNAK